MSCFPLPPLSIFFLPAHTSRLQSQLHIPLSIPIIYSYIARLAEHHLVAMKEGSANQGKMVSRVQAFPSGFPLSASPASLDAYTFLLHPTFEMQVSNRYSRNINADSSSSIDLERGDRSQGNLSAEAMSHLPDISRLGTSLTTKPSCCFAFFQMANQSTIRPLPPTWVSLPL